MTPSVDPVEWMEQARAALEQGNTWATQPFGEGWLRCGAHMERAKELLQGGIAALGGNPGASPGVTAALAGCGHEIRKLKALDAQAAWFYRAWLRIVIDCCESGYSAAGDARYPALVAPGRRVSVEA